MNNKMKSVKSISPCESQPEWLSRAGVIHIINDIVKAHGRVPIVLRHRRIGMKVETKLVEGLPAEASSYIKTTEDKSAQAGRPSVALAKEGTDFNIVLPL